MDRTFCNLFSHQLFEKMFLKRCMMTLGIKAEIGQSMSLIKQRFSGLAWIPISRTRVLHVSAALEGKLAQIEVSLSTLLLLHLWRLCVLIT